MICRSCGQELDDSAAFCTNCGTKNEAPAVAPAAEESSAPKTPSFLAEEEDERTILLSESESAQPEPAAPVENNDMDGETIAIFGGAAPVVESAPEIPASNNDMDGETIAIFGGAAPVVEATPEISASNNDMDGETIAIFGGAAPVVQPEPVPSNAFTPPPVQPQPIPQPVPQPAPAQFVPFGEEAPNFPAAAPRTVETAEKVKTKIGAGRIVFATIVSILAIAFLISGNLVLCVKFGATGKVLSKRIKNLDAQTVLSAKYDDEEIATDIYRTLGIRSLTKGEASETDFKNYLSRTNFLEYIANNVKSYADYLLEGKGDDPSLTSADIAEDFFGDSDNNKIAKQELGSSFSSKDLSYIKKNLEKNDVDDALSIKKWNDKAEFNLKNSRHVFGVATIGITYGIVLVLLICIILIVDKQGKHVMGFYRSVFSIGGLISFIIGIAIVAALPIAYTFTGNVILYLAANVLFTFGLIALCTGAAEIILGFIFNCIRKGIKKKAKAAKKAEA